MRLFTFLKSLAQQFNLFDDTVDVKGHTRKDGVFVKPHQAKRKKKRPEAKKQKPVNTTGDLLDFDESKPHPSQKTVKKEKPDTPVFVPTHELSDGTKVKQNDDEDAGLNEWLDADGTVIEDDHASPLKIETKLAPKPEKPETKPAPVDRLNFGVKPGVTKAERIRLNDKAVNLLDSIEASGKYDDADKAILMQYSGRGGVGDSLNEYYTRPDIAIATWDILAKLNITTGTAAEPSSGTGVYLHTAPEGFKVTAVEMDKTSAGINQVLHGEQHEVVHSAFEHFATSDPRQFDAVVGNVPFGLRGALIKADKKNLKTAEQYFVDTSIDKVVDGGVVALIVPTGIMDNRSTEAFRKRILRKAEFLGAHRMPNTAFEQAHTEVTTDLVIFRKRATDVGQALGVVTDDVMKDLGIWDDEFVSGKYFSTRGKENVYGTPEAGWRAKAGMGDDFTVTGDMAGVADHISGWDPLADAPKVSPTMLDVLAALGDDEKAKSTAISAALRTPYEVAKPGDTKTIDGILYILQGEPPRWHRADGGDVDLPAAVVEAHDVALHIAALAEGRFESDKGRQDAVALLDAYIKKHGNPALNKDLLREAKNDPVLWRLISAVDRFGAYSDLLTGHKLKVESSFDAAAAGIMADQDSFTENEIAAAWSGGDADKALDQLYASAGYALDPTDKRWTTMDEYLSGELWPKYDAVKAALEDEKLSEDRQKFELQEKMLNDAIDPRILDDVEIKINSGFVPVEVIAAFFNSELAIWREENPGASWKPDDMEITYKGGLYTVKGGLWNSDLLAKYLNRNGVRKDDLPKIEEWNRDFKQWVTGSDYREHLEDLYNRKFRGYREKTYSDAPMDIPGLNPAVDVNAYHFSGLRSALDKGKGIIADDVGLGKTARGLMLAKLARASGKAKKPLIVVPKSVLANWVEEAEFWFPGSKVLTIGETVSEGKDGQMKSHSDTSSERDRKYHELVQNDYDFILISQPAWNDLDIDPIEKKELSDKDFWNQRGDALGKAGDKRRKKIKEAFEQATAQRDFKSRSNAIYFNDLGVDMVIGDEFHAYKNLYAVRNRFGESPKFLGGGGLSNRAQDTFFKTQWLRDHNGGKGVYGLTATPTKSSPLEIYSMLSHIAPEAFEAIGIKNSEEFLDRFCEFATENVLTTGGEIEEALVTVGFKNLNELREIMRRYIDRRTAEDVGLALPARNDVQHMIDMTPAQESTYQELRALADGDDDDGDAHIFSVMDKMGKASIDLELLGDEHKGERSPKIDVCADQVVEGLKDGGQVIFTDHIKVHEKLKAELVAKGLKPSEIAIVNAGVAKTSAARQKISNDFNSGKIKVVIGNTATMGEGMNLQKKTSDIHHLDLPWEPASMQQRNGRGLRQGNTNKGVRIHTYLAKGSFDGYRYQTMMAKKDWMDLLWNGGDRVENLAREGKFSRDEMLIMLSADPEAARKQYEENKSAAAERQAAVKRGEAAAAFVKFQSVRRSLSELKDKTSKSAVRLAGVEEKLRLKLESDKFFTAKEALNIKTPVLIQPETGTAYYKGAAFEMDAGKEAPMNWSDTDKSKWVVTEVTHNEIKVRQYAEEGSGIHTIKLADMNHGVSELKYSQEDENRDIASKKRSKEVRDIVASGMGSASSKGDEVSKKMLAATEKAIADTRDKIHMWWEKEQSRAVMRTKIMDALHETAPENMNYDDFKSMVKNVYAGALFADAGIPPGLNNPENLVGMNSMVMEKFNTDIQDHLKQKTRDYHDNWRGPYGLIDKDGELQAFQSYEGRKKLDDHDFILPTKENEIKVLRAWVAMEQSKQIKTNYVSVGRGSHRSEARGVKEAYPGWEYGSDTGNPWTSIGKKLYGDKFEIEARKAFIDNTDHAIKFAHDFHEAITAAVPAAKTNYGGTINWPAETLKSLWAKAANDKLLDKPLKDVLPPGIKKEIFSYQVGSYSQNRSSTLNDNVQDAIIKLANSSGHKDLAAAITVQGAKNSKQPPAETLSTLDDMRISRSNDQSYPFEKTTYHHSPDVIEAMQHVVDAHDLGDKTPREIFGDSHIPSSSMFWTGQARDETMNTLLKDALKQAEA